MDHVVVVNLQKRPSHPPVPGMDEERHINWGLSEIQAAEQVHVVLALPPTCADWVSASMGTAVFGDWMAQRMWGSQAAGLAGSHVGMHMSSLLPTGSHCLGIARSHHLLQKGWEAEAVGEAPYQSKYAFGFRATKIGLHQLQQCTVSSYQGFSWKSSSDSQTYLVAVIGVDWQ